MYTRAFMTVLFPPVLALAGDAAVYGDSSPLADTFASTPAPRIERALPRLK